MKKGFGILAVAPEAPPETPKMEADVPPEPAEETNESPQELAFMPPQGVKVPEVEPGQPFTMPALFKMNEEGEMVLCGVDGKPLPGHEDAADYEMEEIGKMPMEERGPKLRERLEKQPY
jgi:hypothetical protein